MKHTLVVCKPRLPAQYTAQRTELDSELEQLACPVIRMPVFELVPDADGLAKFKAWLGEPAAKPQRIVVFVSPSVLEIALGALGKWPAGVHCAVMGHQSAQLAKRLGVPAEQLLVPTGAVEAESEDADGLAHLIQRMFEAGGCEVLVCKGPRGRVDFPQKLLALGHVVSVLECYDRRVIAQPKDDCEALFKNASDCVMWITSSETIEALDQQLRVCSETYTARLRAQATVLTTHPRITAKCRELGYARVEQITTGIQSVKSWLNSNKKIMDNNTNTPSGTVNSTAVNSVQNSSASQPANRASGQWLGKAAFFVSLVSFSLVLLIAFAGKNQIEKTRLAFGERIQKEATTLDLVKEEISKSSDLAKDLKTRFDLLELAQKEEASQRASLEDLYNSLLASRTEVSLSEVEQLVSVARRQLYLLGNANGASIALSQAIDLLEGTQKPALLNLRTALEKDLSEVKALPSDDLLRLAISLDSVVNSVESLPMLSSVQATTDQTLAELTEEPVQPSSNPESAQVSTAADASGTVSFHSAWVKVKALAGTVWRDIKSLIEVTKVNSPEVLMLSVRQETDLRNTLRLSLLNARISLLSRQATLLKSDLERSSHLINTYFDPNALQVQRAQSVIAQLNEVQLDLVLPELQATSAALRLAVAGQQGERQ